MSREEAALRIGDDFVARRFGETTREEILDHAIRTAMALLTEGVVAAPTEGIGKVGLGRNDDRNATSRSITPAPYGPPAARRRPSRSWSATTFGRHSGSTATIHAPRRSSATSRRSGSTTRS